ncbi:hypothetical protein [Mycolicibacterium sp. CBMA 226]|uniref:hypothetical protein n=1 Tax=Mycolicibacterium sp. CBMA 226 TaxID=2606611 RepID=UPI0012DBCE3C|nr:hypothetical protein [Mycolicibacterium sp. CBMA 226]
MPANANVTFLQARHTTARSRQNIIIGIVYLLDPAHSHGLGGPAWPVQAKTFVG